MDFFRQLFAKKGAIAGLDLGGSSLKMVQLKTGKDRIREIESVVIGSTPDMTIKDGVIVDPRALGDYIRQLILNNKLNVKGVVGAVGGRSVVLRPILMPKMQEKELMQSIRYEADRYLPYSVAEAQIKATILRKDIEGDDKNMEVLLVAAPNEMVKNTQDVIRFAGVVPEAIDMEPFALLRSLELCLEQDELSKTVALINLGASSTSINIYKAGVLRTSRTLLVAGNNFTAAISQALNLSFEEAEKIKKDKGAIRVEKDATPVAPTTMRIFNVIVPVLAELVTEIQRSFDYYRSRYQSEAVEHIVLCGGTSRFKNIDTYISGEVGLPCRIANPLRNMNLSNIPGYTPEALQELAPSLMVSLGLCLRNV